MLRQILATAVVGAMMAAVPRPAGAAIFELTDVVTTVPNPAAGFRNSFPLRLTISDDAVARGSFQLSGRGSGAPSQTIYTGDLLDFGSLLVVDLFDFVTPTYLKGTLNLNATFRPDRTLSSFNLLYQGDLSSTSLTGTNGSLVSGTFGTDRPDCNSALQSGRCTVSGRLVEVPEPMSLALLGMGLLGVAAMRRQAALA